MNSDAPAQARPKQVDESGGNMFLFAAAGIGIYVALKILEPSIAFPLRQISSSLATWFLNALSIPCTLEGTAISTSTFTFDVNPDCSGSTSLRIMLTLGALWFGMYPNLTLGRRLICLAMAAPIAIACNAVRVTALVMLGDGRGEPVEGFPHELVGILSFGLSMGVVYLMTLVMAKEPEVVKRFGPRAHAVILILALGICYAPVIWGAYQYGADSSAGLVHFAMVITGLILVTFTTWRGMTDGKVNSWTAPVLFGLSLLLLPLGTFADVITLSSLSLLGVVFAVILQLCGWKGALMKLPLLAVVALGLPGAQGILLRSFLGQITSQDLTTVLEIVLALGLLGIHLRLHSRSERGEPAASRPVSVRGLVLTAMPMKLFIFSAFLGTLFQTYFNSQAAVFDKVHRIEIPLVLGAWGGIELQPSSVEIAALGRHRIISREYHRPGSEAVHLLANATGADRTRAHPPENCMKNGGWNVIEEKEMVHSSSLGQTPMTRILLSRGGEEVEMRYWLADPEGQIYGNTNALRAVDVTRRLLGQRTDWRVIRVIGRRGSPAIDDFLEALLPTLINKGSTPAED